MARSVEREAVVVGVVGGVGRAGAAEAATGLGRGGGGGGGGGAANEGGGGRPSCSRCCSCLPRSFSGLKTPVPAAKFDVAAAAAGRGAGRGAEGSETMPRCGRGGGRGASSAMCFFFLSFYSFLARSPPLLTRFTPDTARSSFVVFFTRTRRQIRCEHSGKRDAEGVATSRAFIFRRFDEKTSRFFCVRSVGLSLFFFSFRI